MGNTKHTHKRLTIELTEAEYKGIQQYLFEMTGEKANKQDVSMHLQNIVSGYINAPQNAESTYIPSSNY